MSSPKRRGRTLMLYFFMMVKKCAKMNTMVIKLAVTGMKKSLLETVFFTTATMTRIIINNAELG
ncbi:MAG: hypothetical protein BGO35_08790 [Burkholderiales bacterium 64-34]|nr:MAG: hypothetical protein BGO35_08790 [Burkholderiales bacterium 64-34]